MITRLHHWWQKMRSSFWFVPAVIVLGAVGLAAVLIGVDATVELHVVRSWPLLFGAGAAGSRGLLTAVASSMITVAGVVFSITIVALSLTSSQYTSRVLRNFMRDRVNQVVLGVFVGIFAYCLVVLRTIRGGDEGKFVPSLAVLVGLILAFVGIAFLIYFIHHISMSIQASNIIAAAAQETIAAVDHLFPKELGEDADEDAHGAADVSRPTSLVSRPGTRDRLHREYRRGCAPGCGPAARDHPAHGTRRWRVRCPRYSAGLRRRPRRAGRRVDGRAERSLHRQSPTHGGTRCRLRVTANRGHRPQSAVAWHQ